MGVQVEELVLEPDQFEVISRLVYATCGIHLPAGKEMLVQGRLVKRVRALGLSGFGPYLAYLDDDTSGRELSNLVDSLATNKTSFYRESAQFEYLRSNVLPGLRERSGPKRFWSAGCSTGEEPYTLAALLRADWTEAELRKTRILATDISVRALVGAREGIYTRAELDELPPELRAGNFESVDAPDGRRVYRVAPGMRTLVRLARLNLADAWPMRGPFQVIFCRNVMIYFDRALQERLVRRFWELLEPGGHLFVGYSESLTSLSHDFRYARPAVYVR